MGNHKAIKNSIVAICLVTVLIFFALVSDKAARSKKLFKADSGQRLIMGTFARIVAVAENIEIAEKSIEIGFEELKKVDELMSSYKSDSQVSLVNRNAFKEPVKVSQWTYEVLEKAVKFSKLSQGAFDVTIGPLVELWRWAADTNSIPTDNETALARSKVGYEKLILDANEMTVRFSVEAMKLDLGGIAKGYAIDKALEAMKNFGAVGAMVDIGGDIGLFGLPPKGKDYWLIGLQDPRDTTMLGNGKYLLVLRLTDSAIATSGDYRRFFLIGDEKHSHIIDAKTGQSSNILSSVTIISKTAADADALATAVSVMGPEKGLALIEQIPQTEAILIPAGEDYEFVLSSGAEKYLQ